MMQPENLALTVGTANCFKTLTTDLKKCHKNNLVAIVNTALGCT